MRQRDGSSYASRNKASVLGLCQAAVVGAVMVTREMLASKFEMILPHLNERQRRLYLGSGVRELEPGAGSLPPGRARRTGGGRKRLAETDPGLVPALLSLVDPDERGDP